MAQWGSMGAWVVPSKKYSPSTTTSASAMRSSTSPKLSRTCLVTLPLRPARRGSWMKGRSSPPSAASASHGSRKAGSTSYSTRMRASARMAVSSSTAATAATPSPTWRTRSTHSGYSSGVQGMMP